MLLPGVEYTWKVYVFTPTASALGSPAAPQHGMTRGGVINPANSSEEQKFKVTPTLGKHAGSFNIEVKLAYFTPDGAARTVFLEAHTNAAFAGVPAARTICQMDANRPANLTATLFGLDSKQDYYVCAYVRSNPGDGTPLDPGDGIALPGHQPRRSRCRHHWREKRLVVRVRAHHSRSGTPVRVRGKLPLPRHARPRHDPWRPGRDGVRCGMVCVGRGRGWHPASPRTHLDFGYHAPLLQ